MTTLERGAAAVRGVADRVVSRFNRRPPRPGRPPWNHNVAYHHVVLEAAPQPCHRALDVGCGRGLLLEELAARCDQVVGIDDDDAVVAEAARRLDALTNVTVARADIMTADLPEEGFDLVSAVAVLHHLPLEAGLKRLRALVHPGGALVVVGLARAGSPVDYALGALAFPVSNALVLVRGHTDVGAPLADPAETFEEVRAAAERLLPGCRVRRRLLFRYTIEWHRPG